MPVDPDTTSYDTFPTNVTIYNDPLPRADGCDAVTAGVMVVGHGGPADVSARDASHTAANDLSAPFPADADDEALEARRLALLAEGRRLASVRRLAEAYRREADRAAFGTPAPGGPSQAGLVKQRGAVIADTLGVDRPVYATPLENLRAAQAAVDELDGLEAEDLPHMTRRIQQLINAAAQRHEADARAGSPPPRRDHGATSRTPTTSNTRARRGKEPAASRSRTRISIE